MPGAQPSQDQLGQILALSKDCDPTQLELTAAQGYLFSRIDGQTPWRLLREIGGIPADEVDVCLEQWVLDGLVDVVGQQAGASAKSDPGASQDKAKASARPASNTRSPSNTTSGNTPPKTSVDAASRPDAESIAALVQIDESALDGNLELDLDVQRRILEFEASLDRPYHDLLGVPKGSDPKAVKKAYFKLSKEFHPDRYFRREIGGYSARLDRIFKKVLEAHEILSDPELAQVENQSAPEIPAADTAAPAVDAAEVPKTAAKPAAEQAAKAAPAKPRAVSKLERLRQRMPFKIDPKAIMERRAKADEIFRSAVLSQRSGRLQEAESNIKIAISFDPNRAEFKEALGALKLQAAGDRAEKLLASPSDRMTDGELRDCLRLLDDVLMYRPHDPQLNERAARVCLQLKKYDAAAEYVGTLIEGNPDTAEHHTLLGVILRGKGDSEGAMKALETALKIDKECVEAKRTLAALRIGHHDAVQGGRT